MGYLPEKIDISMFSKGVPNPIPVNPEDLDDFDFNKNSTVDVYYVSSRFNKSSVIKNCRITGVRKVGETNEVITIDVGSGYIKCSPYRMIMLSDGSYKIADKLTKHDSLMGITSPVTIVKIDDELLPEIIDIYDITTDPECDNYLTTAGVFIGRVSESGEDDEKEVSESPETLRLKI